MKMPLSLLALATLSTTGCVVHSYDVQDQDVVFVVENYAPQVLAGGAGVFYDPYERDDVWYFDAAVDDADHVSDVVQVWADVWDEHLGIFIESFELAPTSDPYIWYAEYLGRTTLLDPHYPEYTVDIVAYDSYDEHDSLTVWAVTY